MCLGVWTRELPVGAPGAALMNPSTVALGLGLPVGEEGVLEELSKVLNHPAHPGGHFPTLSMLGWGLHPDLPRKCESAGGD